MEVNFKDILQPIYSAFANKVIRYLVNHYGYETMVHGSESDFSMEFTYVPECTFFTYDIGDAVTTISNIFQREYRKMFYYLCDSLRNPERFEKYCMLIPVVKDEIYFYNFLSRIALIFELAKYCFQYEGNKAYFGIVLKCIENYPDMVYFNMAGGWESLKHTASFLAEIGRPLRLITRKDFLVDGNTHTLSHVVKKLQRECLSLGKDQILNSMEMRFLEELSEVSRASASPKSVRKNKHCSPGQSSQDRNEGEKEVLMDYLEKYIKFEKRVANPKQTNVIPIDEKKIQLLYNRLSRVLYNAVVLMKDLSMIEELEKGSQGNDHKGSQSNEGTTGEKPENIQQKSSFVVDCDVPDVGENSSLTTPSKEIVHSSSEFYSRKLEGSSVTKSACTSQSKETYFSQKSTVPTENEGETGPSTRKVETFQPVTKESTGNYGKSTEHETPLAGNRNDETYNFIVPQKYFDEKFPEKLDDCKYLYIARIDPPSRKERMTKRLKKMLDTNLENLNYRLMTNGDFFVGLPDSQLDTLLVIVDSRTDEESDDGDEDLHRLLCLFKKCDLDHESMKDEVRNLRPRKLAIQRKEHRKRSKRSISEATQKQSRELKYSSVTDSAHVRYVTKLYKKQLPFILDMVKHAKSYVLNSSQNSSSFVAEGEASSSNIPDTNTVFVIDQTLLEIRVIDLEEEDQCYDLQGILETTESFSLVSSIPSLPPQYDRELNSLIRSSKYREILNQVYLVGEFSNETEVCYLFAPKTQDESEDEYNRDILTVAELYKMAVDNYQAFNTSSRDFIESVVNALQHKVIGF